MFNRLKKEEDHLEMVEIQQNKKLFNKKANIKIRQMLNKPKKKEDHLEMVEIKQNRELSHKKVNKMQK